jgi:hypothetical protein
MGIEAGVFLEDAFLHAGRRITGYVALDSHAGAKSGKPKPPLITVHLRSPDAARTVSHVSVEGGGAELVTWYANNESALFRLTGVGHNNFSFSAKLSPGH